MRAVASPPRACLRGPHRRKPCGALMLLISISFAVVMMMKASRAFADAHLSGCSFKAIL